MNSLILDSPLYDGASKTVRECVVGVVRIFVEKSESKAQLSANLKHSKSMLPPNNLQPDSFAKIKSLISSELIPLKKLQVCINDCMFYQAQDANLNQCSSCGVDRYREADALGRTVARRYFSYCSLKRSLTMYFRCCNIAQIMQQAGGCQNHMLCDVKDSSQWKRWMAEDEGSTKVILGFNTDGVNPFHSQGVQYSMWPLIFCIMNLPSSLRNKPDAFLLVGVVPSKSYRLNSGLEPNLDIYFELVVDELISLSSTELFSSYKNAPIKVKVSLLVHMMDFQAYSKFFSMSGTAAYLSCNICLMKATWMGTKMSMLGHRNYSSVPMRDYSAEVSIIVSKGASPIIFLHALQSMVLDYWLEINDFFIQALLI